MRAPTPEILISCRKAVRSLSAQSVNLLQSFNDARLREADRSRAGGKVAVSGRPLDLAQMGLSRGMQPLGGAMMGLQDGAGETELRETDLPDNVAIYAAGGLVFDMITIATQSNTATLSRLIGFTAVAAWSISALC